MSRALPVLGRTILRLGRGKVSGVLSVRNADEQTRLYFEDGVVRGFEEQRKRVRTDDKDPAERSFCLRRRLVDKCVRLAGDTLTHSSFEHVTAPARFVLIEEPFSPLDLVLRIARRLPLGPQATRVLRTGWELTATGEALEDAALSPTEAALLAALRALPRHRGLDLADIAGGHGALKTLAAWRELGLIRSPRADGRHSALVARRQAIRRGEESVRDLRARRRLAARLHPDRFEPELQLTSREVMEKLLAGSR